VVEVLLLCGLGTHFCALSRLLVLRVIEICELWLGDFCVQCWVLFCFVFFLFFGGTMKGFLVDKLWRGRV